MSFLKKLGPGLITGAADDDPSGIATYSQAGAQFGLNLLWTILLTYPLMVGIQVVSARIGRVSGHGLGQHRRMFADRQSIKNSLEHTPMTAKRFYGIIAVSTVIGIGLGFTPIDPIKALYWSAVINGVISVPIMVVMMLMAARPDVMGPFVVTTRLKVLGWLATLMMAVAVVAMFLTL